MDRRTAGLGPPDRHFACTQCGACCNRAPELELGESANFADTFVLQLLMRIYSLPRSVADHASELPREQAVAEYFESKRLLGAFSATSWPAKVRRGDRVVEYVQYLSLSVLPLDLGGPACPALVEGKCSIYARRPLSCRSVPLHYSRPDSAATRDLDAFVASPDYQCDISNAAPLVIAEDRMVDPETRAARTAAAAQAEADRHWKATLVKAMKAGQHGLPSPRAVEAQAARGALTASMLGAWRIADAAGLIEPGEVKRQLNAQCRLIDQTLQRSVSPDARATLGEMQHEYRAALTAL